ncbi:MAG: hypothetical protein QOJ89_1412 [bacterium]|jgi:hypothetical protein
MRQRLVVLAVLAGLAAATSAAQAANVRVTASVSPRPAHFGDLVEATLTVRGGGDVTVQGGFAPFRIVSERTSRTGSGDGTVRVWRFALQCLEARCAPGPGARNVALAPTRVQAGSSVVVARFPAVRVEPRATEAQVAHPARSFMHPTTPPPPTFRFSPRTTQTVLVAAAAVLVAVALALLAPLARRRRAPLPAEEADALARALALVQDARARPPADRRRALGLLSRVLRRRGSATGQEAADLAWSEPDPDPASMDRLVERIEKVP